MTGPRQRIVIEGWRFLAHSYALVNHFQCVELLRRGEVELFHVDVPRLVPGWPSMDVVISPEADAAVRGIPAPPADVQADAWLSFQAMYRTEPARQAKRTFTFGTCEFGVVPPLSLGLTLERAPAMRDTGVTYIVPSNWSREGFLRCGVPNERAVVVPHGVDPAIFRPAKDDSEVAAERARLAWEGSFVFLNLGAMTWNKGITALLAGFAAVLEKEPQALLALKGMDSMYGSSSRLSEELSLLPAQVAERVRARIVYVGESLSFHDVARLYRAADAYVCPYRAEGFNLPALEAAACGLPVICTAGGPTEDFVRPEFARKVKSERKSAMPGHPGWYLEPSVASLVGQMMFVIREKSFREEAREAGPAHVRGRYTWEKVVGELVGVMVA